jgi:hypothetical protein
MSAGDVRLGVLGSEILLPRPGLRFSETDEEIIEEERTIEGTLCSDLIAVKKHFEIPYDPAILGSNLDLFLALYDLHQELNMIVNREDDTNDTYTVVLRPLSRERALVRDIWLWTGVTLVLDEV